MSFDDARKILEGSDTAATDYFKGKTSKKLQTAFKPSVTDVMNQVGVNQQYNALVSKYKDVPFSKNIAFDVNQYVTRRAPTASSSSSPRKKRKSEPIRRRG